MTSNEPSKATSAVILEGGVLSCTACSVQVNLLVVDGELQAADGAYVCKTCGKCLWCKPKEAGHGI